MRPAFAVRFDLRNPAFAGVSGVDRYRAALEMAEWADEHGALAVVLNEHHGCDDGYLPSALTMAAAVAARTSRVVIQVAAVVASLHDPLRLAEESAVVDLISGGRLRLVVAAGYVPSEFAMFDAALADRGRRVDETVSVLRQAWTGEPFEYRGRTVQVTPRPHQAGGPPLSVGGSSAAAARRGGATRRRVHAIGPGGLGALPRRAPRDGRARSGPRVRRHVVVHVHRRRCRAGVGDDRSLRACTTPREYGRWAAEGGIAGSTGYEQAPDIAALRAGGHYRVLTPDALVDELGAAPFPFVMLHPMMGGIPPDSAWESLRSFESVLDRG